MTPRSWLPSKSFWFGIVVLGLLAVSWSRSVRSFEELEYEFGRGRPGIAIGQGGGRLRLRWDTYTGGHGLRFRTGPLPAPRWFPPPLKVFGLPPGDFSVDVAHWFLVLAFLAPWSFHLARQRRRLRDLEATETKP